jgi:glycerate 2-kinase
LSLESPYRQQRALLQDVFAAGVNAVRAKDYLPPHLPRHPAAGRTVMIALGKAAGDMAAVAMEHIAIDAGLVIIPRGGLPADDVLPPHVEVIVAGHPVPDSESARAGTHALALAEALGPEDRLLVLLSGGGSALMVAPAPPLTLADKIAINEQLLRSGAPIADINRVRQRMSLTKGGGLAAAAAPAEVITLVVSDIPGDDISLVASGPTIAATDDPGLPMVAARWGIGLPSALYHPRPVVAPLAGTIACVASADRALAAMAVTLEAAGYACLNLGGALVGDAVDLGRQHAALASTCAANGRRLAIVSGGETSVEVRGVSGRGGRNLSYLAGLALALNGHPEIVAMAADSDGIDGNSGVAGAMIFPDTLARLMADQLDLASLVEACDTARAFRALDDVFETGPTYTNVNDLRCILVS